MSLDDMEASDGRADLLLVIGTLLKAQGAATLVKSLSKKVHASGGAVIYINRGSPSPGPWAGHIDLHLETDIEEWARDSSNVVSKFDRVPFFSAN
jgi:NAD-dependent SIR2 family protein deacetylase